MKHPHTAANPDAIAEFDATPRSEAIARDSATRGFRPLTIWGAIGVAAGANLAAVIIIAAVMVARALNVIPYCLPLRAGEMVTPTFLMPYEIAWCVLLAGSLFLIRRIWKATPWREHLALRRVNLGNIAFWITAHTVFTGMAVALAGFTSLPFIRASMAVPDFSSPSLAISRILSVVIMAPLYEEMVFRGFLFRAMELSRLRAPGAVIVTALLFGAVHGPGSPLAAAYFVGVGVLLGLARWRTNSLVTSWAMHAFNNALWAIGILGIHVIAK